jgi:hypothetical protein
MEQCTKLLNWAWKTKSWLARSPIAFAQGDWASTMRKSGMLLESSTLPSSKGSNSENVRGLDFDRRFAVESIDHSKVGFRFS